MLWCKFKNKNGLIVDESIIRIATSKEIVQMAKDAGQIKFFTSRHPCSIPSCLWN